MEHIGKHSNDRHFQNENQGRRGKQIRHNLKPCGHMWTEVFLTLGDKCFIWKGVSGFAYWRCAEQGADSFHNFFTNTTKHLQSCPLSFPLIFLRASLSSVNGAVSQAWESGHAPTLHSLLQNLITQESKFSLLSRTNCRLRAQKILWVATLSKETVKAAIAW